MQPKQFRGFYPALVTPYTQNKQVDFTSLKKLIERLILEGVDGFYITGSTGECFLLTHEERLEVIRFVLRETAGRVKTIVHVGSTSTMEATELGKFAQEHGADAISAVPPFYYKYSFDELKVHYDTIMAGCNLPMFLYNFPALSGVTFTIDNIKELFRNQQMFGIKHTSMNLYELEQFKRACPNMVVFNGHDEVLLGGLSMGADGAIGSTFNVIFPIIRAVAVAFQAGELDAAREHQINANQVIDALVRSGVNQGVKYLLESQYDTPCNGCRPPMKSISQASKAELDLLFAQLRKQGAL